MYVLCILEIISQSIKQTKLFWSKLSYIFHTYLVRPSPANNASLFAELCSEFGRLFVVKLVACRFWPLLLAFGSAVGFF